eukprot:gb/GFBE01047124.1/.p1 GENE.gb/GFBE01047124.1/~~gb/GFBE01047124.1/.p1  ORF type:complete len:514 (+),score=112.27 gb/GFBE01047124.1/:1-1542(+)
MGRVTAADAAMALGEEQRPLVEQDVPSQGGKPAWRVAAFVAGFGGVALLFCGAALLRAPGSARSVSSPGFLAMYADGEVFEEGGQMFKHSCKQTSSYSLEKVQHNNFGGAGPDPGDEGIQIKALRHKPDWLCPDGDCFQEVTIELHAKSNYSFSNPHMNGMNGRFATITLNTGDSVEVQLLVRDHHTGKVLQLPFLPLSVYDLDENADGSGREFVIAHSRHITTLKPNAKILRTRVGTSHGYEALRGQGAAYNPTHPTHLTPDQQTRSVAFNFIEPKDVRFKIGSEKGRAFRMFSFSLFNALSNCYDELYGVTEAPTSTEAPTTTEAPKATTTEVLVKTLAKEEQTTPWLFYAFAGTSVLVAALLAWYFCLRPEEKPVPPPPPSPLPAVEEAAPLLSSPRPVEKRRLVLSFCEVGNEVGAEVKTCAVTQKPVGMVFQVGIFPLTIVTLQEGTELHKGGIRANMQLLRHRSDTKLGNEDWQEQEWVDVATSGDWQKVYQSVTAKIAMLEPKPDS